MQLRAIIQTFLTVCDCFLRALYWLYPTKEHILPKIVTSVVFLSATHHIFRSHVQSLEEKCASVKYEKRDKITFALQTSDALLPTPICRSQQQ